MAQSDIVTWGIPVRAVFDADTIVQMDFGASHAVSLSRDGEVSCWDSNLSNTIPLTVPTFPAAPVAVAAGNAYSAALLADGTIVSWGVTGPGVTIPALTGGLTYTSISCYGESLVALLSNGHARVWKSDGTLLPVPTLPAGVTYVQGAAGVTSWLLRSDGELEAVSTASITVPTGPFSFVASGNFGIAIRATTGEAVSFSNNGGAGPAVPQLPPGIKYVQASINYHHGVLLRSDGIAIPVGTDYFGAGVLEVRGPVDGLRYTSVHAGRRECIALRQDGRIDHWGGLGIPPAYASVVREPRTSPDMRFPVRLISNGDATYLVRSNGEVDSWGTAVTIPAPDPGSNFANRFLAYRSVDVGPLGEWAVVTTYDDVEFMGQPVPVPSTQAPQRYSSIEVGTHYGVVLDNMGGVVAFDDNLQIVSNVPTAILGLTLDVEIAGTRALALLGDGTLVEWDTTTSTPQVLSGTPTPPAGLSFVKIAAAPQFALALLSDGTIAAWGTSSHVLSNIPALPAGLTYVDIAAGDEHAVAIRSDGQALAFGSNASGQLDVPSLHSGQAYVKASCGAAHTALLRSDGAVFTVGMYGDVTAVTPSTIQPRSDGIFAWYNTAALNGSGGIEFINFKYGYSSSSPGTIPDPAILESDLDQIVATASSYLQVHVLTSSGEVYYFGGPASTSTLPSQGQYVDLDASGYQLGMMVAGGSLEFSGPSIGAPPAGLPTSGYRDFTIAGGVWTAAGPMGASVVAVDPSGQLAGWGNGPSNLLMFPSIPAGVEVWEVDCGTSHCLARLSDGSVVAWGDNSLGQTIVPPLPANLTYVEISAGTNRSLARLSDGSVAEWGNLPAGWTTAPAAPAGKTFNSISAGLNVFAGRQGPPSTYLKIGSGCQNSNQMVPGLTPRSTPKIGEEFLVRVDSLPNSLAIMYMSTSAPAAPFDLSGIGMTGCTGYIDLATSASVAIGGTGSTADWSLMIPDDVQLVGMTFRNQAIVLDSGHNPAGLVISDAYEGHVGF